MENKKGSKGEKKSKLEEKQQVTEKEVVWVEVEVEMTVKSQVMDVTKQEAKYRYIKRKAT